MTNTQLPYGFTDDHFNAPDENGNRFFNAAGKQHAQNNLPTQATIASQIGHANFGSQPPPQVQQGLSPTLQQGMDTGNNAQPMSSQQASNLIGTAASSNMLGATASDAASGVGTVGEFGSSAAAGAGSSSGLMAYLEALI